MRRSSFRDPTPALMFSARRRHAACGAPFSGTRGDIGRTETKRIGLIFCVRAPAWGDFHLDESISPEGEKSNFRPNFRRGNSANAGVLRRRYVPRQGCDTIDWCTGVMNWLAASHFSRHIPRIVAAPRLSTGDIKLPFFGTKSTGVRHVFGQRNSLTSEFSRAYRPPHSMPNSELWSEGFGESASEHR